MAIPVPAVSPAVCRDIVVIGASAGGVEALQKLVGGLKPGMPAALFVVLHYPAGVASALPSILRRAGPLPAAHAKDGQPVERGVITIAPPDRHLILRAGHVELTRDASEHSHRPAVDPMFRSAALAYGPRTVGVVLSGTLDDGAFGLSTIKHVGGVAVVQDPEEAAFASMPKSALEAVEVDHCLPVTGIASLLDRLAREPIEIPAKPPAYEGEEDGDPSTFSCPDCGGCLWEKHAEGTIRFRCRTGHAYSLASLAAGQSREIEEALWVAIRAFEEKIALTKRVQARARQASQDAVVERIDRRLKLLERQANAIRRIVTGHAK
jgi:two-component system chemotaxis response regulator CheB